MTCSRENDIVEGELVIQVEQAPGMVVLTLHGELDLASAPALQRQLEAGHGCGAELVLVDLADLSFIDSTGLQVLLRAHHGLREGGRELVLAPGPPAVARLFALTRTDELFRFVERG